MTAILTNSQERTRFLKFMAVGAFGALVDFGIANLLAHFLICRWFMLAAYRLPAR